MRDDAVFFRVFVGVRRVRWDVFEGGIEGFVYGLDVVVERKWSVKVEIKVFGLNNGGIELFFIEIEKILGGVELKEKLGVWFEWVVDYRVSCFRREV